MKYKEIECQNCSKRFIRKSVVQKYCTPCGSLVGRKRDQQKYREKRMIDKEIKLGRILIEIIRRNCGYQGDDK